MKILSPNQPAILRSALEYWRDSASRKGPLAATGELVAACWEFLRDSTPYRLRQRFGDAEYDWEFRVNTTSGAVGWRDRLLGVFHSRYQPTEPALFQEMLSKLEELQGLNFREFTFIDLGSGKGRTLLMASEYPFRRVIGVELLPALNQIAQQNLAQYNSESQRCFAIQSVCADATRFAFPIVPLVVYLFNPFPEAGLRRTLLNLQDSLKQHPRPTCLLYHNPQLEHLIGECTFLQKRGGTHQYSIFASAAEPGR